LKQNSFLKCPNRLKNKSKNNFRYKPTSTKLNKEGAAQLITQSSSKIGKKKKKNSSSIETQKKSSKTNKKTVLIN